MQQAGVRGSPCSTSLSTRAPHSRNARRQRWRSGRAGRAVVSATTVETIEVPGDSFGSTHSVKVYRFGTPGARPKVYLQGALHANELPPIVVLHHLRQKLSGLPEEAIRGAEGYFLPAGEIIVVPSCNPMGLSQVFLNSQVGRYHAASGLNYNRRIPDTTAAAIAALEGKLTPRPDENAELLRQALAQVAAAGAEAALRGEGGPTADLILKWCLLKLSADADIILDVHSDSEGVLHMYTSDLCWPAATDLAAAIKAQSVLIARDAGGDSFDDACLHPHTNVREHFPDTPFPELDVLSATIEYRGNDDVDDKLAEQDAEALLAFFRGRGVIEATGGKARWKHSEPKIRKGIATPLSGVQQVKAPKSGIVLWRYDVGETVKEGALLAELLDPTVEDAAQARFGVFAETTGQLIARRRDKLARAGDVIGKLAGPEPLPGRSRGLLLQD